MMTRTAHNFSFFKLTFDIKDMLSFPKEFIRIKAMKVRCFILALSVLSLPAFSQTIPDEKIKLFVDCSNSYCDMNYLKTKIKFVDYVFDNKLADIHLLITQQINGGGGSQYQLIFYGQHHFLQSDTLHFNTKANNTEFENRDLLVKYIQIGLLPFISKTRGIENISFLIKEEGGSDSTKKEKITRDKWNYWVYRINLNGSYSTDANYKSLNYNGAISAGRVTDKLKVSFNLSKGNNRNTYQFSDPTGTTKILVKNESFDIGHEVAVSISQHWSVGYDLGLSRSTFSNYKFRSFIRPAIEYDVFPYKDVNTKLFTIRYGLDITNNQYFDTTIYFKDHETLPGQELDAILTYNQKWGTINLFSSYHAYLQNLKRYNLSLGGGANVRITGGLSFNIFVFGNILRDQIYLPKGQASIQDILTRQRQLATNFSIQSFFGINYRFGSTLNNFVNPRFNSGGGNFFF